MFDNDLKKRLFIITMSFCTFLSLFILTSEEKTIVYKKSLNKINE
mgnify:CR=1 FL=1